MEFKVSELEREPIEFDLELAPGVVGFGEEAEQSGAAIKVVPINERGEIEQDQYAALLSPRTKIVAIGHGLPCFLELAGERFAIRRGLPRVFQRGSCFFEIAVHARTIGGGRQARGTLRQRPGHAAYVARL